MADYNPRQISETQFEALKRSITEFGFAEPVIVNTHPDRLNMIVGGHMRVRAAAALGWTEVPCVEVQLDLNREKLLNIALNRIHGEWDQDKLAELVVGLQEAGADLQLSGMEEGELKLLQEEGMLKLPDLGNDGPETKSITIYLPPADMDELLGIVGRYEGTSISDKVLAMARKCNDQAA